MFDVGSFLLCVCCVCVARVCRQTYYGDDVILKKNRNYFENSSEAIFLLTNTIQYHQATLSAQEKIKAIAKELIIKN